jgi:hypothetical protein
LRPILLSALLLLLPAPTFADTVYTYTGNTFTTFLAEPGAPSNAYNTLNSVSGSFTVSSPLAANLSSYEFTPTAYSFTDGVNTFDTAPESVVNSFFEVWTDSSGDITAWVINMGNELYGGTGEIATYGEYVTGPGVSLEDFGSHWSTPNDVDTESVGFSLNNPGVWTSNAPPLSSAVPEPASLTLIATGVFGMASLIRRRFQA